MFSVQGGGSLCPGSLCPGGVSLQNKMTDTCFWKYYLPLRSVNIGKIQYVNNTRTETPLDSDPWTQTPQAATAVVGTHPTGMHSCFNMQMTDMPTIPTLGTSEKPDSSVSNTKEVAKICLKTFKR